MSEREENLIKQRSHWEDRCMELEEMLEYWVTKWDAVGKALVDDSELMGRYKTYRNKHKPESVSDVAREFVEHWVDIVDKYPIAYQDSKVAQMLEKFRQALANEEN